MVPVGVDAAEMEPFRQHDSRNDSGDDQIERPDQLENSGQEHAFLSFPEGFRAECPLDDLLVCAPVEYLDEKGCL